MKVALLFAGIATQSLALPADISTLIPRQSEENSKARDERRETAHLNRWKKFQEYQEWQRVTWQKWQEDQDANKKAAAEWASKSGEKGKASFGAKQAAEDARVAAEAAQKKADDASAEWKAAADHANDIYVKKSEAGAEKPAWDAKHKAGANMKAATSEADAAEKAADDAEEKAEAAEKEYRELKNKAEYAAAHIYDPSKAKTAPEEKEDDAKRPAGGRHPNPNVPKSSAAPVS